MRRLERGGELNIKDLVNESKWRVDEEFGSKFSEKSSEKKKLVWKEVKSEMGNKGNECESGERLVFLYVVERRRKEYGRNILNAY